MQKSISVLQTIFQNNRVWFAAVAAAGYIRSCFRRVQKKTTACSRCRSEAAAIENEQAYFGLIEAAPDIIFRLDTRGILTQVNPAFEKITGWQAAAAVGKHFTELIHPEDIIKASIRFEEAIFRGKIPPSTVIRILSKSGIYLIGEFSAAPFRKNGEIAGMLGIARDITERTWAAEQLRRLAYYDPLTGLPNRELFIDRLRQSLIQSHRSGKMAAVMFLDLDRFKEVNNTLGHRTGDQLLIAVAERLAGCVRESDTVARLSGDEFIIVFPDIRQPDDAAFIANKVLRAFSDPFPVVGLDLFVTASIGISLFPTDGNDAETLMKHADVSRYQAKDLGGNTYRFYSHTMHAEALRKLVLQNHLRAAIENEEIILHYQPLIDLSTGRVCGAEALARWQHPIMGLLLPGEFIPLAEKTGQIIPLGEMLIRKACVQAKIWQDARMGFRLIAVNLSMRQFCQGNIAGLVATALKSSGLGARHLELELTESMLIQDIERTISILRSLKDIGVQLSIDDFGTGYSSLSCLKNLPLNTLKLDRSFVRLIHSERSDQAVSRAIIVLAHNLGLRVIAEGVETKDQLEFLRNIGCDMAQGFLFSKPVHPADFDRLMFGEAA